MSTCHDCGYDCGEHADDCPVATGRSREWTARIKRYGRDPMEAMSDYDALQGSLDRRTAERDATARTLITQHKEIAALTARVAASREWLYDYASMLQLAISQHGIDPKSWESANDRLTKVIAHLRSTEFADGEKQL